MRLKKTLLTVNGVTDIQAEIQNTGVNVHTVCADYFMEAPCIQKIMVPVAQIKVIR